MYGYRFEHVQIRQVVVGFGRVLLSVYGLFVYEVDSRQYARFQILRLLVQYVYAAAVQRVELFRVARIGYGGHCVVVGIDVHLVDSINRMVEIFDSTVHLLAAHLRHRNLDVGRHVPVRRIRFVAYVTFVERVVSSVAHQRGDTVSFAVEQFRRQPPPRPEQ